jgi:WD40 repeat protein/HEAT repeat protein
MSRSRAALVILVAGLATLVAWIMLVKTERVAEHTVRIPFVEDPEAPTVFGEDPPPPLPDRALARLGPIKDAVPTGYLNFSPDGRLLLVGTKTGLQLWNLPKQKLVRTMPGYYGAWFSPDGKTLATLQPWAGPDPPGNGYYRCQLILSDVMTGKEIRRYPGPYGWILHLNFLDNSKIMHVSDKGVYILDLESGTQTLVCHTPSFDAFSLDFSPKTMTVAYVPHGLAAQPKSPVLLHCRSNKTDTLDGVKMWNNPAVRLSHDGKVVATMGGEALHLFNAETAEAMPTPETSSVDKCVFSPDGRLIAWLSTFDKSIHCIDLTTGKNLPSFEEPFSHVTGFAFSPDGNVIASTLSDNSIVLWDVNAKPADFNVVEAQRAARRELARTRVRIVAEKKRYFVGEEIYVDHITENIGKVSIEYEKGGDYRGATRHLFYYLQAMHEDGTKMPDPDPNQMCFGGLAQGVKLAPGQEDPERLNLLAYRRLDRPGKYHISAGKGSVEDIIELVVPTPEQARKLVDDLDAKNKPRADQKGEPHEIREYRRLTHPVYLPLMSERARAGSYSALLALGETPDPKATRVLIELLDNPDPKFVYKVQEALYLRMPDPILDAKLHKRNVFDQEAVDHRTYLRDRSWRPEFAESVRKHARQCLAKRDVASLFRGAFMLSCIGTAEDLPDLIAAFDFAVKNTQGKPLEKGYPRPPGACGELRRAAQMFVERGAPVSEAPKTSGEKILFVEKINRDKNYRPPVWEATFVSIMKDEMDYVREVALDRCPSPVPANLKSVIAERMRDAHVDVRIAALHLVEKNRLPEWKAPVLEALANADEEWLRNAAGNAAYQLCDRLELTERYVALIDNPKQSKFAVEALTFILRDGGSKSLGTDVDTPEKSQKCKAVWLKFVAENREKLKEKEPFSLKDPIPIANLFPGIHFYSRE